MRPQELPLLTTRAPSDGAISFPAGESSSNEVTARTVSYGERVPDRWEIRNILRLTEKFGPYVVGLA